MIDPSSQVDPIVVIPPTVLDAPGTLVSSVLDVRGYEVVEFLCTGGGWTTPAVATLLIEHGDLADGADMAPVPDALLYHTEADATITAADTLGRVGYRAATGKRYVRVTYAITPVVTGMAPALPPNGAAPTNNAFDPQGNFVGFFTDGGILDTNGYALVSFILVVGAAGGTGPFTGTWTVRHSDSPTFSGGVDAPDSLLDALESTTTWSSDALPAVSRIGYYAGKTDAKRYVRLRLDTFGGTWDETSTITVGAGAHLLNMPTATGVSVLGLFRSVRSTVV